MDNIKRQTYADRNADKEMREVRAHVSPCVGRVRAGHAAEVPVVRVEDDDEDREGDDMKDSGRIKRLICWSDAIIEFHCQ